MIWEAASDLSSASDFKMDRNINILLDFYSSLWVYIIIYANLFSCFSEMFLACSSIATNAEIQFLLQVFL